MATVLDSSILNKQAMQPVSKKATKCFHCEAGYSLLNRKHSCGHCKRWFCSNCTSRKVLIPKFGHNSPIHVCSTCFAAMCTELNDKKSLDGLTIIELKRFAQVLGTDVNGAIEKRDIVDKITATLETASIPVQQTATSYSLKKEELPKPTADSEDSKWSQSKNSYSNLEELNVGSLKLILHNNGVDYTDCIEKLDLIQKITKHCPHVLNVKSKSELFNIPEQEQCIICYDRRIDAVLLECGHLAVCVTCTKNLRECPICRRLVSRVVQIFHVNK